MPHREWRTSAVSQGRRVRGWMVGIVIAAVAAFLTQVLTGAFTSAGSALWERIDGKEPLQIRVTKQPGEPRPPSPTTTQAKPLQAPLKHKKAIYSAKPHWVIPRPLSQIPIPPGGDQGFDARAKWAADLGGVDAQFSSVEVTIKGTGKQKVILKNLTVEIVERKPPLQGIDVDYGPIGDVVDWRYLLFDLDAIPPRLVGSSDDRYIPEDQRHPVRFPYRAVWDSSLPEVFVIAAVTEKCDCKWVAKLAWEVDNKPGVTVIDDNGQPFRTTGITNAPTYISVNGEKLSKGP